MPCPKYEQERILLQSFAEGRYGDRGGFATKVQRTPEEAYNETDTIWKITSDYKTIPKYVIEIGGKKMLLEEHTESNLTNLSHSVKYNILEGYLESTRYMFFKTYYASERRLYHIYYDKYTKETHRTEFKKLFGKRNSLFIL